MKNHSRRQSGRTDQLKEVIRNHYIALQDAWKLELEVPKVDWFGLFRLHDRITEMERRAPWLKKEVA